MADPKKTTSTDESSEGTEAIEPDAEETLEAELVSLRARLDEMQTAWKLALAEQANVSRRSQEREKDVRQEGQASVVRSVLSVIDQFDLAIDQESKSMTIEQLIDGVKLVRSGLLATLGSHGVKPIDVEVGEEFDPHHHAAVLRQPSDEIEPNHVVCIVQTGYTMGDRVLRPAKVIVAAPPTEES